MLSFTLPQGIRGSLGPGKVRKNKATGTVLKHIYHTITLSKLLSTRNFGRMHISNKESSNIKTKKVFATVRMGDLKEESRSKIRKWSDLECVFESKANRGC